MKEWFFVRHGETLWNAERRMQGRSNSDLNEVGREQARINGELLASLDIEAMVVSPLARTRETADIINRRLSVPVAFDDRIMEWDCGDWSGHLYAEVSQKWPEEWAALQADRFHFRGPNCENYPDMMVRAGTFLADLHRHEARRIAIVSHGMIGRVMVSLLLGLNETETLDVHQPNDVVFAISLDAERKHVAHYRRGQGPIDGILTH